MTLSDTFEFDARATSVAGLGFVITLRADSATSNASAEAIPTGVPPSIPTDQAYYWSVPWQQDVRESLRALQAGDYEDFDDPSDASDVVRWFLADDDEDD